MEEEKGKWEEEIRSKLYDFEADAAPEDWNIIAGKLPAGGKSVRLYPYRRYGYTAAAVAALLIAAGLYFYSSDDRAPETATVADRPAAGAIADDPATAEAPPPPATGVAADDSATAEAPPPAAGVAADDPETAEAPPPATGVAADDPETAKAPPPATGVAADDPETAEAPPPAAMEQPFLDYDYATAKAESPLTAEDADSVVREFLDAERAKPAGKSLIADASSGRKSRRWGFGMGGGSYSVNPTSTSVLSVNSLANLRSDEHINDKEIMKVKEDDFMKLRRDPVAPAETHSSGIKTQSYETPAGKIKYKTPVSIGLGVSYYVNGRWSLQSGLTYTLLRSEGKMGDASDRLESKQNLHYIGIPLSVAFRIAEWKRFQLYASAGGMGEYNVAGTYKETVTSGDTRMTNRERVHMKEPMWSVNARAGINYPLWRFVHVYAEAGASYYFDNKSEIKTIRSDKPFNASLQAGFRLGF